MEADGARREQPVERRRQHVLPGVLLHVIEPPRPVDRAVHRSARARLRPRAALDTMCSDLAVVLVHDVDDHADAIAERAGVERLTAGGGIEGGPIERTAGRPSRSSTARDDARRIRGYTDRV